MKSYSSSSQIEKEGWILIRVKASPHQRNTQINLTSNVFTTILARFQVSNGHLTDITLTPSK